MRTLAGLTALVWLARGASAPREVARPGPGERRDRHGRRHLHRRLGDALPFGLASAWWERRRGLSTGVLRRRLGSAWGNLLGASLIVVVVFALVLCFLARRFGRRCGPSQRRCSSASSPFLQFVWPYSSPPARSRVRRASLVAAVRQLEQREHAGNPSVRVEKVSGTRARQMRYSLAGPEPKTSGVLGHAARRSVQFRQVRFVARTSSRIWRGTTLGNPSVGSLSSRS